MSSYTPRQAIAQENGIVWFPVSFMRGGTSTGLVIDEQHAPTDVALREELLRLLMGVPQVGELPGNRQITGLGRGPATSNKVFFVTAEPGREGRPRLVTTLAQLAANHARIDWSVNCGNMSSALPLWALHAGLAEGVSGDFEIELFNTNTGVLTTGRVLREEGDRLAMVEIPGVPGSHPGVDLYLHDPVGAKTGALLPTGNIVDEILGVEVSCVDVAVPMVIIDARAFGKTATEPVSELEADTRFLEALKAVWVEAGLRMRLAKRDGTLMSRDEVGLSETVPKVCIIGPPKQGGHLSVRYFTPQTAHASMAVSGGCCLAAATLIPGTVASRIAPAEPKVGPAYKEFTIGMENPAGTLEAMVVAREDNGCLAVQSVAYRRSAQMLHQGHVPLYSASPDLVTALRALG